MGVPQVWRVTNSVAEAVGRGSRLPSNSRKERYKFTASGRRELSGRMSLSKEEAGGGESVRPSPLLPLCRLPPFAV